MPICGKPLFFARCETLLGSAFNIRPFSSHRSLSSIHAYPSRTHQSMPISNAVSNVFASTGMIPFPPTPTGIWSNNACATSSFSGCTSASVKFVLTNRTPQLISKPTPPGETTAFGSFTSNAATFPMANPYPECTSGNAIDRPTIPGNDATFAICFTAGKNPPARPRSACCFNSSNVNPARNLFT